MPSTSQNCHDRACGFARLPHEEDPMQVVAEEMLVDRTLQLLDGHRPDADSQHDYPLPPSHHMAAYVCAHAIYEGHCPWFSGAYDRRTGQYEIVWRRNGEKIG